MLYQKMVTRQKSPAKSRSFTRALALAFYEWLLLLMLFANSIFSYVITRFADYFELQSPCLMCSRVDHILGKTKHLKKYHWDMICSKHKSDISSLVECHAHGKLVDVRGMCETCLYSFATTNKSNAETYRLLVGKLGEDSSCFESKSDSNQNPRSCTCCSHVQEFFSPRDISPKVCSDQEIKNQDQDMQLLLQKRMLERNESNLSLEGVSVSEIEGESESDRLKRQVDHDRRLLTGLYKELEEERSASAVATNQSMAMITRLQEEKALFQMKALQNLRMMEEQAEYDMEAIQKRNDLLVEREKLIQDLEAEIECFRDQTPQKKKSKLDVAENVTEIDSPTERMRNKIQSCLTGFQEERLYIRSCLEKIENRVQIDVNCEADHVDNLATQEYVSELYERVETLKGDLYFLEHVVNSLGHRNEGVQFVKEIASHLQNLRSLSMRRKDHRES